MLSLPTPATSNGGEIAKIRQFLNVNDANYVLILAWLVNCFRPDYPFPVLILSGEQGSAKSTTSRLLRELVDPNKTAFRSAPRDERDLVIAANNG
jgi:pantothenate kinase-related protein Tda10